MNSRTRTTIPTDDDRVEMDYHLANGGFTMEGHEEEPGGPGRAPIPMALEVDEIHLSDEELDPNEDVHESKTDKPRRGRPRGSVAVVELPPIPEGTTVSVYERLTQYGLLRKITDIVLVKVGVPWHLRPDAVQEVHAAWCGLVVKPEFQRNQLANYAYLSGQHAALKLRRTLGAVVTIPGAAFRTGRDSAFMGAIGAAINPRDVDDFKDSIELSIDNSDISHLSHVSEAFFIQRMGSLSLTSKQRQVAYKTLIERKQAPVVAEEMDMPLLYVERLINQVANKLQSLDANKAGKGKSAKSAPKQIESDEVPEAVPVDAEVSVGVRRLAALRSGTARQASLFPA